MRNPEWEFEVPEVVVVNTSTHAPRPLHHEVQFLRPPPPPPPSMSKPEWEFEVPEVVVVKTSTRALRLVLRIE